MASVITLNKKHSSKQVVLMNYTLGKNFLQLLLLKVCETFLFRQSNNVYSILWSVSVFFPFLENRRPNRCWLWEENLVFHMQIFNLTCQSVNLFSKIAVNGVSAYFCGVHKNHLRLQFRSSFKNTTGGCSCTYIHREFDDIYKSGN